MLKISDYNLEEWNKKVIFGANATGKTKTAEALYNRINALDGGSESAQLMNSQTIEDLVKLSGKIAYVGLSAKNLLAIDEIYQKIDSSNKIKEVFKLYDVSTATNLAKKSLIFEKYKISNSRTSVFLEKVNYFQFVDEEEISNISLEDAIYFDTIINESEYKFVLDLNTKTSEINYIYSENAQKITSKNYEPLQTLKEYIEINLLEVCPLCGSEFGDSKQLISAVERKLDSYVLDQNIYLFEEIDKIYSYILKLNKSIVEKYDINVSVPHENYKEKVLVLINFIKLVNISSKVILSNVKKYFLDELQAIEESNLKKLKEDVEDEQKRIKDNEMFFESIKSNFDKLVIMPKELKLIVVDNKLWILKNTEKMEIRKTLSESEIKRLALAVLKAQIDNSVINYIILDDPIDSYDDYFFEKACEFICRMIKESNIKWTIMTHLFSAFAIFSKHLKGEYIYCQYDMDYKYEENKELPETKNISLGAGQIDKLLQHEIVIAGKVLSGIKRYKIDKHLASLAITCTVRNCSCEIFGLFHISYKNSKIEKKVFNMENRYFHYSDYSDYYFYELMQLYKKLWKEIDENLFEYTADGNRTCSEIRKEIIKKKYSTIISSNPLIKEIYMKMVKISYCKYELEKKLIERIKNAGISQKKLSGIFKGKKLYNKINIAKEILKTEKVDCDLTDIELVFEENREIINNFSHGTTRMFPPYLSVSIYDIEKLIYNIERLEVYI